MPIPLNGVKCKGRMKKRKPVDKLFYERGLWGKGYKLVAGVDEVGRGPLAGPVVAACVIFPEDINLPGIDDSKKLTPKKREELYQKIKENALDFGIGIIQEREIDKLNIFRASLKAMQKAISSMENAPHFLLIDGNQKIPHLDIPQLPVIKGDTLSLSCGAASIIAKVERDRMMKKLHKKYPQFSFDQNKGYASKEHLEALVKFGPCKIHRRSFKRVMECTVQQEHLNLNGKDENRSEG
ncbi:MAG TPA: ribonuclease HII [Terriglobales bacterium]|nr:ribonuclease HII [Terriglobales bacterium]